MVLYLETSGVLAWLLGESTAAAVRQTVDAADTIVTSVLTSVEALRALVRAETRGQIAPADRQRLRGLLARAQRAWTLMELSPEVRERAGERFPIEPLRTLDSLHLATALAFARAYADLQVLSFDQRIIKNAEALGLGVSEGSDAVR